MFFITPYTGCNRAHLWLMLQVHLRPSSLITFFGLHFSRTFLVVHNRKHTSSLLISLNKLCSCPLFSVYGKIIIIERVKLTTLSCHEQVLTGESYCKYKSIWKSTNLFGICKMRNRLLKQRLFPLF